MAFLNLTINIPSETIAQINNELIDDSTKPFEGIRAAVKILEAIELGTKNGVVELTTQDTDPGVVASGDGITATYNLR
jgi:hypothetical protein